MTEVEKRKGRIINLVYFLIIIAGFYLFMNYAFGLCFPFIFGFIVAVALQKPVNLLTKKTPLKRGLASVLCVFILVFVVGTVAYLIGFKLVDELRGFFDYVMLKFENIPQLVDDIEKWINNCIASFPQQLQSLLSSATDKIFNTLDKLAATTGDTPAIPESTTSGSSLMNFEFSWLSGPLSGVISTASKIPSIIIGVVVSIIASCFLTVDYQKLKNFIIAQFPEKKQADLRRAKNLLKESLTKMGKAYALIIIITFFEMFVGLSALKLIGVYSAGYIPIIALVTAIVDILPILGTGTILLPWALISLITGNFGLGIGLLVIYGVITVIRQIIEPKLVAGQLGLPPIVTLACIYFGLKLFSVLGMFITPVAVVMIKTLNDEGIIHLWKPGAYDNGEKEEEGNKGFVARLLEKRKAGKK